MITDDEARALMLELGQQAESESPPPGAFTAKEWLQLNHNEGRLLDWTVHKAVRFLMRQDGLQHGNYKAVSDYKIAMHFWKE